MGILKITLLLSSLILFRIILVATPSFRIDLVSWQAWTNRLVEVGPSQFYSPNFFADYFPGYLYILWILGSLLRLIFPTFDFFSIDYAIILKIVTNCFDIATAYYIFKIVKRQKIWAYFASILYLGNPTLIFNTSVWGQVDGVLTFFLVYSIYSLLELKQPLRWSISTSLSILIKPQALATLPIMLIYNLRNFPLKKAVLSIILLSILPIIISIPFFTHDPLFGLFKLFKNTAEGYKYTSLYAFNFWSIIGWWKDDTQTWFAIPYQLWGLFIYLIFLTILVIPLIRRKTLDKKSIYLAAAISVMIFFLFPTRVHERYLFPFFAFFIIAACLQKSVKLILLYLILSLLHFANLLYVYFYYNNIYPNPTLTKPIIYILIDQSYRLMAVSNLGVFIIILRDYYSLRLLSKQSI